MNNDNRGNIVFGYLQIQKSELLVREYDAYKAVYCGLCKQMGKDYSFFMRMTLSYDCTFYAMLLMSLSSSCKGFKDGRCTCNPLKKCKFAIDNGNAYRKAAAFSVISVYYKILDDIKDSGFLKSLALKIIKPFFSHNKKKAANRYPEFDEIVSEMMNLQENAESDSEFTIDKAAHPTAKMLAEVFSLEADDDMQKRTFYEFGYHIGRWIYLIDAVDDIEKDIKKNNVNPFYDRNKNTKKDIQYIIFTLNQSLARAYDAYNLIDNLKDFKGILDNMILKGFPTIQNSITDKYINKE